MTRQRQFHSPEYGSWFEPHETYVVLDLLSDWERPTVAVLRARLALAEARLRELTGEPPAKPRMPLIGTRS